MVDIHGIWVPYLWTVSFVVYVKVATGFTWAELLTLKKVKKRELD